MPHFSHFCCRSPAGAKRTTTRRPAGFSALGNQGNATVVDFDGRKCLRMDGAAAELKDFQMRDGVIDVDAYTSAIRGVVGFDFRIAKDESNYEEVYFRQHESGLPDALQYTPVLSTGHATGNFSMDRVSPQAPIFRKKNGSTCGWKSPVHRPSCT